MNAIEERVKQARELCGCTACKPFGGVSPQSCPMSAAIYASLSETRSGIAQGVCNVGYHHASGTPHPKNEHCVDWKFVHMHWMER